MQGRLYILVFAALTDQFSRTFGFLVDRRIPNQVSPNFLAVPSPFPAMMCAKGDQVQPLAGAIEGFYVIKKYPFPFLKSIEDVRAINENVDRTTIDRLNLTETDLTVPVALMLMSPEEFPTFSKARKACRKRSVVVFREQGAKRQPTVARTIDRVHPGDSLGIQERQSHGTYSQLLSFAKPSFELPVVYEDDYMAIVNKPPGILVYEDGGKGRGNIRYALPYVLNPPSSSIEDCLERPEACHRLDKPTSGLLVVAKTKSAIAHISRQFENRQVKKTYTALVHGVPNEESSPSITNKAAAEMGFDVDITDQEQLWHAADSTQDGKPAFTLWRILKSHPSVISQSKYMSLVELKPKTGRFHQLRRHMAWDYGCPIVGDTLYGDEKEGNTYHFKRWRRGLMLCATKTTLQHPVDGEKVVSVSIEVPSKFTKYLQAEHNRIKWQQPSRLEADDRDLESGGSTAAQT